MSYFDVLNKAYELTVVTDHITGISYLQPSYKMLLREANIHLPDYHAIANNNDDELWEAVKLEVEKRNAMLNFVNPVAEWMYSIIATTIDPSVSEEENELMKTILEYMKEKNGKKQRRSTKNNTDKSQAQN